MRVLTGLLAAAILISTLDVSQPADAGKGIRIVGSMQDESRILLLVQNAFGKDLYSISIESFSGIISTVEPVAGWGYADLVTGRTFSISTDDSPLKSRGSMRFHINVEPVKSEPELKFKWIGYGADSEQVAAGAFKTINKTYLPAPTVNLGIRKVSLCAWDGWGEHVDGSPRSYLISAKAGICGESDEPLPPASLLIEMKGPYKAWASRWLTTDSDGIATINFRVYDAGPYTLSITKIMGKNIRYDPSNDRVSTSIFIVLKFPGE